MSRVYLPRQQSYNGKRSVLATVRIYASLTAVPGLSLEGKSAYLSWLRSTASLEKSYFYNLKCLLKVGIGCKDVLTQEIGPLQSTRPGYSDQLLQPSLKPTVPCLISEKVSEDVEESAGTRFSPER